MNAILYMFCTWALKHEPHSVLAWTTALNKLFYCIYIPWNWMYVSGSQVIVPPRADQTWICITSGYIYHVLQNMSCWHLLFLQSTHKWFPIIFQSLLAHNWDWSKCDSSFSTDSKFSTILCLANWKPSTKSILQEVTLTGRALRLNIQCVVSFYSFACCSHNTFVNRLARWTITWAFAFLNYWLVPNLLVQNSSSFSLQKINKATFSSSLQLFVISFSCTIWPAWHGMTHSASIHMCTNVTLPCTWSVNITFRVPTCVLWGSNHLYH